MAITAVLYHQNLAQFFSLQAEDQGESVHIVRGYQGEGGKLQGENRLARSITECIGYCSVDKQNLAGSIGTRLHLLYINYALNTL